MLDTPSVAAGAVVGTRRRARVSRPTDLAARCYDAIREDILHRRLLPGERVAPEELARRLGVSRTPVQEALKRLALEGMVEIHPRRGTLVTRITAQSVTELADVRVMIEVHAGRAAIERATAADIQALRAHVDGLEAILASADEQEALGRWSPANAALHRFIVQLAGNPRLLPLYPTRNLLGVRELYALGGYGLTPLKEGQADHWRILQAFEQRDAAMLEAVLRHHIQRATERVVTTLNLLGGTL